MIQAHINISAQTSLTGELDIRDYVCFRFNDMARGVSKYYEGGGTIDRESNKLLLFADNLRHWKCDEYDLSDCLGVFTENNRVDIFLCGYRWISGEMYGDCASLPNCNYLARYYDNNDVITYGENVAVVDMTRFRVTMRDKVLFSKRYSFNKEALAYQYPLTIAYTTQNDKILVGWWSREEGKFIGDPEPFSRNLLDIRL